MDSVEAALAAEAGGADRIELCASLATGGVTPSAGMMSLTGERLALPMHVLVLPRSGGFVPTAADVDVMRRDLAMARAAGASGVVLGALGEDGRIDREVTARLIGWSRPMSVTFHRAFDQVPEPLAALEALLGLGVDRVLTAGGTEGAVAGADLLARLVARGGNAITILAAGGVRAHNVTALVGRTGVREVHARDIAGMRAALERREG